MDELYFGTALRSFAISMISLFLPIYLLKLGFSLQTIVLYYVFVNVVAFGTLRLSLKSVNTIGIKHTIFLSTIFFVLYFVGLYTLNLSLIGLFSLGIFYALGLMFYWFPFHVMFAKQSSDTKRGRQLGVHQVLTFLLTILGPLLGGFITTRFDSGFLILFILSGMLLIFSGFIFLFTKDHPESLRIQPSKALRVLPKQDILPLVGAKLRTDSLLVFWPIFMYVVLAQTLEIGIIASIANLILTIVTLFVGRLTDVYDKIKLLRYGTKAHSLTILFRSLATSVSQLATLQILGAFTFAFINIPYAASIYQNSKKKNILSYIYAQELIYRFSAIFLFGSVALLLTFIESLPVLFGIIFLIGATGSLWMGKLRT